MLIDFLCAKVIAAYNCQLLDEVKMAYGQKRREVPVWSMICFYENSRPYTAAVFTEKLDKTHWQTFEYPPCSPDQSLSDDHIIQTLQEELGGYHFDNNKTGI